MILNYYILYTSQQEKYIDIRVEDILNSHNHEYIYVQKFLKQDLSSEYENFTTRFN